MGLNAGGAKVHLYVRIFSMDTGKPAVHWQKRKKHYIKIKEIG